MRPAPGSPSSGVRRTASARRGLSDATIRRIEQATGRLATQSVARMDEELAWFRQLPADQRSWVSLVAQAGVQSYVDWLRSPDDVLRLTGEVFARAPRAMARSVTLQQTVELVRLTIAVAEDNLPALVGPVDAGEVREELLRFSREIAFAAARVYASAAESRGLVGRAARGAGDRRPGPRCRGRRPAATASSPRSAGGQAGRSPQSSGRAPDGRGRHQRGAPSCSRRWAWTRSPACTAAG